MKKAISVERVKGTSDQMGAERAAVRCIQGILQDFLASYGYLEIDTPVLEHTELYLRKGGGGVLSKTYAFTDQGGRRLSLRPEFTASVMRAYIEHGQGLPLPLRWQYCGPVFRYERPQQGRYRQFTQLGLELLGSASPRADAEVVALACRALEAVGLKHYHLVLGHLGTALQLLESLGLSERAKTFLLLAIDQLSSKERKLEEIIRDLEEAIPVRVSEEEAKLGASLHSLEPAEAQLMVYGLLRDSNGFTGGREPEEIVGRLLRKLANRDEKKRVEQALDFVAQLCRIKGEPAKALARAKALVTKANLDLNPLMQLAHIIQLLGEHGLEGANITLDFGLARGLAYYTGMVFEIYHERLAKERQLCGGGRYDGLARALGSARDIPALGFACGLERVKEALEAAGGPTQSNLPVDALVVSRTPRAYAYALRVADFLRGAGKRVEMDTKERSVRANLEYAGRRRIPQVVLVEEGDAPRHRFLVRDMESGEERYASFGTA